MKFSYSPTQVRAAAEFLWNNSPVVKRWPDAPKSVEDVEAVIMRYIRRQVKSAIDRPDDVDGWGYVSTGGFTVQMWNEGEDWKSVEVEVDPAIGLDPDFQYLDCDSITEDDLTW